MDSTQHAEQEQFQSISSKLTRRFTILVSVIFIAVLLVTVQLTRRIVRRHVNQARVLIHTGMVDEGLTLVRNNGVALHELALSNSFELVHDLVSATVRGNEAIEYGIFMDAFKMPTVSVSEDTKWQLPPTVPLEDSRSIWAHELSAPAHAAFSTNDGVHYEFAAPVVVEGVQLGTIRYGYNPSKMQRRIAKAERAGRRMLLANLLWIAALYGVSLALGIFFIGRLAVKVTEPIAALVESTKEIGRGNYDLPVSLHSNDEIGNLAEQFESMRRRIKRYTDDLQGIIDEKMRQVRDILDNIDQGLFTVNADGTINEGYSARASALFDVSDLSSHRVDELFRMDERERKAFTMWLELVAKRHHHQRWVKLTRLAPVKSVAVASDADRPRHVELQYQKVVEPDGSVNKVMVLATDRTLERSRQRQLERARQEHELEVRTILAVSHTPPEELRAFIEQSTESLARISDHVSAFERTSGSGVLDMAVYTEQVAEIMRRTHTLKGNSGSMGLDELAESTHRIEDFVLQLKSSGPSVRARITEELRAAVAESEHLLQLVSEKRDQIFGSEEDASTRVPRELVASILERCAEVDNDAVTGPTRRLVQTCRMLSWKPLVTMCRRYDRAVQRAARLTGRNARLVVLHDQLFYPPDLLGELEDVLLHLVYNAVDHGIEPVSEREDAGKAEGQVLLSVTLNAETVVVSVADDGAGIDTRAVVRTAIAQGLLTQEDAEQMSDHQKWQFMFRSGFSTSREVSRISGRGVGLDAVRQRVEKLGGSIDVDSEAGMGTAFVITIPRTEAYRGAGSRSPGTVTSRS